MNLAMANSSVNASEQKCTMLVQFDRAPNQLELKRMLESDSAKTKADAMKQVIAMMLNGEQLGDLFFTIVRYVLPTDDHTVQRLLLLYLETIKKTDGSGKLLPEMILICNNLRNNLQHPNEYLRGVTLRFLCRIHEEDILEPLVPSILSCLDHRKTFVRRNAVLAVHAVAKLPKGDVLIPDSAEIVDHFLRQEEDPGARRNAFVFLSQRDEDRALQYLFDTRSSVAEWHDTLQLAALQLVRGASRSKPEHKGTFVQVVLALIQSPSASVVFEAASVLTALSLAPSAVRAVAGCYVQLLVSQSDNNVRLIVLDKIDKLKQRHLGVVREFLMDILRALSSQSLEVRRKVLDLAMALVSRNTVDDMIQFLKKEMIRSQTKDVEHGAQYRQLLISTIHHCAVNFMSVAGSVIHMLMDFLGDSSTASALEVVYFVREIAEASSQLRATVMRRMMDTFRQTHSGRVCACALWIMSEYASSVQEVKGALETIRTSLGDLPLASQSEEDVVSREEAIQPSGRTVVLADGSYATQSSTAHDISGALGQSQHNVRTLVLGGDFFLGGVVAMTATKLLLRMRAMGGLSGPDFNRVAAQYMLYFVAILRLGENAAVGGPLDADSYERIMLALQALTSNNNALSALFLEGPHDPPEDACGARGASAAMAWGGEAKTGPEAAPVITQLKSSADALLGEKEDTSIAAALGATGGPSRQRVLPLTGMSDPVYAEALVTVHQYDIVMDVSVLNRTAEPMRNVTLELATMGDLKVVEKPPPASLGPGESKTIRANVKVSSTETGVIFGNLAFESKGYGERSVVVMSDIHVDIMDYINPASVPDAQFRAMWAEFEWENKVAVNTRLRDPHAFVRQICQATNMRSLTPARSADEDCRFLAANLYARSVFGEDALVNVSVERTAGESLEGHIRIRSKTQGIALSLGDKITLHQASLVAST